MPLYEISGIENIQELLEAPTWEAAEELFKGKHPTATNIKKMQELPLNYDEKLYPKYVMILSGEGKHCAMAKEGRTGYYRDAGQWGCPTKILDGKLFISIPSMPWLDGKQLVEVTQEEWAKDNEGYL